MKTAPGTKPSKWIPAEEFNAIYGRVPRLNVEVLIRTPEGVVLTKRSIEPCLGQWHIPGGTVYFGDTLVETVKRVAMEELGVEVEVGQQLGYIEYLNMHAAGYKGWAIGIAFEATIIGGQLTGSYQGEELRCFKEVPKNVIADQAELLRTFLKSA